MIKRYKTKFRTRIRQFIDSFEGNVILRSDLKDLGLPRQVSRALKVLIEDGVLIRLGRGVYAKARRNEYIDTPVLQGVFENVCVESLNRLGIAWELGAAIKAYNEGKTQQIPVVFIIKLKDRFRGTLSDGKQTLIFEGNINAR
jgi:hypothetical protein